MSGLVSSTDLVRWFAWFESKRMEQRVVRLALRDLEGKMAMKVKRNERGQSVLLFAILMPIMSLFLLGILDYMVTNARVMETVAAADLTAHAGAQEITVLPDGTITAT